MVGVKYTGFAHFRELSKADFKMAGVEVLKLIRFARGEVIDLDDAAVEALVTNPIFRGDFAKAELPTTKASPAEAAPVSDDEEWVDTSTSNASVTPDGGSADNSEVASGSSSSAQSRTLKRSKVASRSEVGSA